VEGVAQAAFGYQGQKCSACSRAIVSEKVYDTFCAEIGGARKKDNGRAERRSGELHGAGGERIGNERDFELHRSWKEGRKSCTGRGPRAGRWIFCAADDYCGRGSKARIAQEEIFGPVLTVIRRKILTMRCESRMTRSLGLPERCIRRTKQNWKRPKKYSCRQSLSESQMHGRDGRSASFGGFNMSGTDSKTGGKDYLLPLPAGKIDFRKIDELSGDVGCTNRA